MAAHSKSDIGFGKKIRASWLDLSLDHVAAGRTFGEAKAELTALVQRDNAGKDAARKALSCLNRVWFDPPSWCRPTRDAALEVFLQNGSQKTRSILRWGMSIAAYPFVGSVAEIIGRLIKLQGLAKSSDIKRRVQEKHGDREFVQRIVRYNISSFLDWGALAETSTKGEYSPSSLIKLSDPTELAWLTEALLHARPENSLSVAQLRQHPMLFPFDAGDAGLGLSKSNPRIQVVRHGTVDDVIHLRMAQ